MRPWRRHGFQPTRGDGRRIGFSPGLNRGGRKFSWTIPRAVGVHSTRHQWKGIFQIPVAVEGLRPTRSSHIYICFFGRDQVTIMMFSANPMFGCITPDCLWMPVKVERRLPFREPCFKVHLHISNNIRQCRRYGIEHAQRPPGQFFPEPGRAMQGFSPSRISRHRDVHCPLVTGLYPRCDPIAAATSGSSGWVLFCATSTSKPSPCLLCWLGTPGIDPGEARPLPIIRETNHHVGR